VSKPNRMIKIQHLLQKNLRIRLTVWYISLLAAILALFCTYLYWQFGKTLLKQVDTHLKVTASEIIISLQQKNNYPIFEDYLHSDQSSNNIINANLVVRLIGDDGQIWDEIGRSKNLTKFIPKQVGMNSIKYQNNYWRIYSQNIYYHQQKGWIQVAESLEEITKAKEHLLTIMLLGLPLMLVIASFGGFFLTSSSLLPIQKIIRTAEAIRPNEINRRINYSGSLDEVGRLAMTLDRMLERIQGAFENERRFTANASHELRTPLTVMKGRIEVTLSRERNIADYKNTLNDLEKEVNRLIRITDGLLLLTHLEQTTLNTQSVNIDNLLEILIESFQPRAEEKSITLTDDISPDLIILGDSDYITSLFMNLLDNAFKYTPRNGKVVVEAWKEENQVCIMITNNGQGIPQEALPYLFQRFYRVENDIDKHRSGVGLGLAIAEEIVRLHKGTITVDSQPFNYTGFKVSLPAIEK